jgi:hypothetical protein
MTPPPVQAEHKAAAGTAIDKVTIDRLALDSPITRQKDPNGLEFLRFKYTDNDGKVYLCVLPAAMAGGEHTLSEWLSTFNVYRKPEVLAQKAVERKPGEKLGDFPFISPKPRAQEKQLEQPKTPRPTVNLPTMPSAPTTTTKGQPTMPGSPGAPSGTPPPVQLPEEGMRTR